ncbi:MAG: Enolase [uncultured Thermomicrobiales bacterium]|uniref:Enolase n=1 Tax=uncultured Thermomicrobiales bacterium TaxID=1645740 RepID=A0A6J4UE74_9BACT|nr:MAG: Enolase [uncultured Thermomicrobiales bacterium]
MPTIEEIEGLEILDSRGRPTVQATLTLTGAARARAQVPSGASTGGAEARELRDGDPSRYNGLGCRRAAENLSGEIRATAATRSFPDQAAFDRFLIDLDGTPDKRRLGANAILAASIAFARAHAVERNLPFYRHLADVAALPRPSTLPRPTINLFSGGKHAGGQVAIQDVLVVPIRATSTDEALAVVAAVYAAAADLSLRRYGSRALVADEGGLAPAFPSPEAMLDDATTAISLAGFAPGEDVALAVDVAASHFYEHGRYRIDDTLTPTAMIGRIGAWLDSYPIVSIEDGLAEEDWASWPLLRQRIGQRALVLGDDLLTTNPDRIRRAVAAEAATALLLKVNQIGTLTEAATALGLARSAGWSVTVSARSGETEDDWLADLAVGWGGDQIKVGSIARSERLAKYNRLLEIEAETGLPLAGWPRTGR